MSSSDKLSQRMYEIQAKQKSLHDQLHNLEKQIYALETKYLEDTQAFGNVVKGWDNLLSGRQKPTGSVHKSRKIKDTERMFSMSSVTVPSAEEVAAWETSNFAFAEQQHAVQQSIAANKKKNSEQRGAGKNTRKRK